MVEVTQADREAAWFIRPDCFSKEEYANWRLGVYDGSRSIQTLAKHRESSVAELQAEVERLREALQIAAKQFRFYEESHLLKETTDGIAKAVANRRCAEQCEIALAQKEPVE